MISPHTRPRVSIVVALYNEEDNVAPLCAAIREALDGWGRSYEVLLVDDGSVDRTPEHLDAERSADSRLRVIRMLRNSGQTAAMSAGFSHSRGEVVVSMDGDLQNDPRDIPSIVDRLESGYDMVCGWRKDRQDKWLSRKLPSRVANRMIAWLTRIPIHDNGCSLKAYRGDVIRSLNLYSEMHRFLPAMSSMTGARIAEVVVRHHPRIHGESKYGIKRTLLVLSDMIAIKMIIHFAARPGRWFSKLALPWLAAGLALAVLWLARIGLGAGTGSIVLPTISVLCLWLSGQLLSLSILSEALVSHSERNQLRRLNEVLTRVWIPEPPVGSPVDVVQGT